MAFDIAGARNAGYSDAQITDYLSGNDAVKFDVKGALKAGHTPTDVLNEIAPPQKSFIDKVKNFASKVAEDPPSTLKSMMTLPQRATEEAGNLQRTGEYPGGASGQMPAGLEGALLTVGSGLVGPKGRMGPAANPEAAKLSQDATVTAQTIASEAPQPSLQGAAPQAAPAQPSPQPTPAPQPAPAPQAAPGAPAAAPSGPTFMDRVKEHGPSVALDLLVHAMTGSPVGVGATIGSFAKSALKSSLKPAAEAPAAAAAPVRVPTRPTGPEVSPLPEPWGAPAPAPEAPVLAKPPQEMAQDLMDFVRARNKADKNADKQTSLEGMPLIRQLAAKSKLEQQAKSQELQGLLGQLSAQSKRAPWQTPGVTDITPPPAPPPQLALPKPSWQTPGVSEAPPLPPQPMPAPAPQLVLPPPTAPAAQPPGAPINMPGPPQPLALPKPYGAIPMPAPAEQLALPKPRLPWNAPELTPTKAPPVSWTPENVLIMQKMLAEGKSMREVADVLGTTRNAIIGKSNRLKTAPEAGAEAATEAGAPPSPAPSQALPPGFSPERLQQLLVAQKQNMQNSPSPPPVAAARALAKVAENKPTIVAKPAEIAPPVADKVEEGIPDFLKRMPAAKATTVEDRIIAAQAKVREKSGRALLSDIRAEMPDVPPAEFDKAIKALSFKEGSGHSLMRLDNRAELTPEISAGALRIGKEPREILWSRAGAEPALSAGTKGRDALLEAMNNARDSRNTVSSQDNARSLDLLPHTSADIADPAAAAEHIAHNLRAINPAKVKDVGDFVSYVEPFIRAQDKAAREVSKVTGIDEHTLVQHMRALGSRTAAKAFSEELQHFEPTKASRIAAVMDKAIKEKTWRKK